MCTYRRCSPPDRYRAACGCFPSRPASLLLAVCACPWLGSNFGWGPLPAVEVAADAPPRVLWSRISSRARTMSREASGRPPLAQYDASSPAPKRSGTQRLHRRDATPTRPALHNTLYTPGSASPGIMGRLKSYVVHTLPFAQAIIGSPSAKSVSFSHPVVQEEVRLLLCSPLVLPWLG